jgi:hypothetical protein
LESGGSVIKFGGINQSEDPMRTSFTILAMAFSLGLLAQNREIKTAVPYLLYAPDARGTALGTIGAASMPDDFSAHWNPAKYAFSDKRFGVSISYTPFYWLLIQDYDPWDLSFGFKAFNLYFKIKDKMAISTSMVYYAIGEVTFTDEFGNELGIYEAYDFYNDVSFSYRINDVLSLGIAGRFIYSDLTQGQYVQGAETPAGISFAIDLSTYYEKEISLGSKEGSLAWGINISNIGSKMSYSETAVSKNFIPTNLRAGVGLTTQFNSANSLTLLADFNKLLVPTPPVYATDSATGLPVYDEEGNPVIEKGKDPDVSAIRGMFQSWYDAPYGFEEEMQEWSFGIGVEYWLLSKFSARAGIYYENESKGSRRYFTTGIGLRLGSFGFDTGFLIPFEEDGFNAFNMRSSLMIDIGSWKK